jgi:D-amino-acid dehydrogenase
VHIGIIGGGLIGVFSAYYLNQSGYNITIFDSEGEVPSASYGNAGMICPSHFIPLAAPGIIKQSLKWMFDSKSPLLFRPYLDVDFLKWCASFYFHSSKKNLTENTGLMSGLLEWSKHLYHELEAKEIIPSIQKKGIIMYTNTVHGLDEEIQLAKKANTLGIKTEVLTNNDISNLNPGVHFNGNGGVHYTGDMHTDPALLLSAMKTFLEEKGVKFIKSKTKRFTTDKDNIKSIKTNTNEYEVDAMIICTGMSSGETAGLFGDSLFIQGGKGYNLTVSNASPQLVTPMILVEGRVAITPMGTALRIGGTMEIGKPSDTINKNRIEGILTNTEKYLPDFKKSELEKIKPWYGYRPVSKNGMPIIKKLEQYKNVFINTGHGMLGLSLAPASGKIMDEIVKISI